MDDSQSERKKDGLRRTFAAGLLSGPCTKEVAEFCSWAARKAGGRPVLPGKLHVTLRFYGDSDPDQVAVQRKRIIEAGMLVERFAAPVEGQRWMPRRDPRVLWLELLPIAPLLRLQQLQFRKGESQERLFRPHVTVLRGRRGEFSELFMSSVEEEVGPIEIESVALLESHLHPDRAHYEIIERFRLADTPPRRPGGNGKGH